MSFPVLILKSKAPRTLQNCTVATYSGSSPFSVNSAHLRVTLPVHIRTEVPVSSLDLYTSYPDWLFRGFPQSLQENSCSILIFTVTAGLSEDRGRPMTFGTRVRPNAMLMCLRPCINIDLHRVFGLSGNPPYSLQTRAYHGREQSVLYRAFYRRTARRRADDIIAAKRPMTPSVL